MNNESQQLGKIKILLVILALIAVGGIVWFVVSKNTNHQQPAAEGTRVTYAGMIETIDLSPMARDGDGVYTVKANGQTITVHLSPGEPTCDRTAIAIPNARIGDQVAVSGDVESNGAVRVCNSGTYIRT